MCRNALLSAGELGLVTSSRGCREETVGGFRLDSRPHAGARDHADPFECSARYSRTYRAFAALQVKQRHPFR